MRATLVGLAGWVLLGLSPTFVQAGPPPYWQGPPQAPDACGCGWYNAHPNGMVYGPNFNVYPPFPPWNGLVPGPRTGDGGGGSPSFPTHPYARSPRDFFMVYDNWYDLGYLRGYYRP